MTGLTQQQQAAIEHLNEWRVGALFMDADELLRFKQLSGLAELFKDRDYSKATDV